MFEKMKEKQEVFLFTVDRLFEWRKKQKQKQKKPRLPKSANQEFKLSKTRRELSLKTNHHRIKILLDCLTKLEVLLKGGKKAQFNLKKSVEMARERRANEREDLYGVPGVAKMFTRVCIYILIHVNFHLLCTGF